MIDVRRSWEERAETYGNAPQGVLFKGFSEQTNAVLHAWHESVVAMRLLPLLPGEAKVLDLGCGYGRIATGIATIRPDLEIVGQDLSGSYCRSFHEGGWPVVQAAIEALPFANESLDAIVAVTSLMYVPETYRSSAYAGIHRVLKKGSYALFFDPGAELQKVLRKVAMRSASGPATGGAGFSSHEIVMLAQEAGFRICAMGGNPAFTALAMLFRGRARYLWQKKWLERGLRLDLDRGGDRRMVLHRWVLLQKL